MLDPDLLLRIDKGRLPRHIAIVMDGNGRWAQRRMLPRNAGHRAGVTRSMRSSPPRADLASRTSPSMPFQQRIGPGRQGKFACS